MRIDQMSALDLRAAYRAGTLSVRAVALACIARAAQIDSGEGGLNAVREFNPDALFEWHRLDLMFFIGFTNIAPFCGCPCMTMPIGLKADGVTTGSYFMARKYGKEMLLRAGRGIEGMENA